MKQYNVGVYGLGAHGYETNNLTVFAATPKDACIRAIANTPLKHAEAWTPFHGCPTASYSKYQANKDAKK